MMSFDRVLPELTRICESADPSGEHYLRFCVVRDVKGRVRLVVEPKQGAPAADCAELARLLSGALDGYFVGPILSTADAGDTRRLAVRLLESAGQNWPVGWPRSVEDPFGGARGDLAIGKRWSGIERTIGKEVWLAADPPSPPWPLVPGRTPAIVTFHSFKGGVGRTTLVAAYAMRLAAAARPCRVAIVDLDLEAPGLGSLWGASPARGVLDVLVDHLATDTTDLTDVGVPAPLPVPMPGSITVFGAAPMGDVYLQKLARLDFSSSEPGETNPVGRALSAMLQKMKDQFDVILLDSRAGLHDLAGLSLHRLAHVDVLVFRGTQQNFAGLRQTLRVLATRKDRRIVLVETMLPGRDPELFDKRLRASRQRAYDMLLDEQVYRDDNPPQLPDRGEPHDVLPIAYKDWLDSLESIQGRHQELLGDPEIGALAARIDEARDARDPSAEGGEDEA